MLDVLKMCFLLGLTALSLSGPSAWAQPVQIQDDQGRQVVLSQPPQRIVSLLPSLTEMVCDLGRCDRLVGVDRYTQWPASVSNLPRVGGGLDPNIEAVVALRPDVVLMSSSTRAAQRLESLGLKVVQLNTGSLEEAQRVYLRLGQFLAVPDAEAKWRRIDEEVSRAANQLPPSVRNMRVYFEVNAGPYGAGRSSFMGEIMARLGVQNILGPELGPFPKLNPEFVVRANPDVIMIGDSRVSDMLARPGWQTIRAVREQRVCAFSPEESDILVRPGPRMGQAAQIMSRCLRSHAK